MKQSAIDARPKSLCGACPERPLNGYRSSRVANRRVPARITGG